MKTIFISIIIFLLFGCNSSPIVNDFSGTWTLVKSNGISFNVCPKVKLIEKDRITSSLNSVDEHISFDKKVVFSHGDTAK